MQLLDGPWVVVHHDERIDCVDLVWKRFTPSRELRFVLAALRAGVVKPPPRWYLDHTRMKVLALEDHAFIDGWLAEWMATLTCRRRTRIAFVNSVDVFGRKSVERLAARLGATYPSFDVEVFDVRGAAREWLLSDPKEESWT